MYSWTQELCLTLSRFSFAAGSWLSSKQVSRTVIGSFYSFKLLFFFIGKPVIILRNRLKVLSIFVFSFPKLHIWSSSLQSKTVFSPASRKSVLNREEYGTFGPDVGNGVNYPIGDGFNEHQNDSRLMMSSCTHAPPCSSATVSYSQLESSKPYSSVTEWCNRNLTGARYSFSEPF